jgi:hypothetical protein
MWLTLKILLEIFSTFFCFLQNVKNSPVHEKGKVKSKEKEAPPEKETIPETSIYTK